MVTGAGNTNRGFAEFFEDFTGYQTDVDAYAINNTVSGATASVTAIGEGGVARIALEASDAQSANFATPVIWRPDKGGPLIVEARVRTSDASKSSMFFGLTDDLDDTVIIEDEDGALNTVPADAVGFLLEGEQDGTWQAVSVKNNINGPQTPLGHDAFDAKDSRWQLLTLIVNESGDVKFYIDGSLQTEDFVERSNSAQYSVLCRLRRGRTRDGLLRRPGLHLRLPAPRTVAMPLLDLPGVREEDSDGGFSQRPVLESERG